MSIVRDGEVELWYEVAGSGPVLVLTGGFGLLDEQFHAVRPFLVDHFTVVDWHYRGSGRSTRGTGIGFDRWVDDLELVLAEVDVVDALLWGTSTGSPLTIRYAARYPQRVRGVIVHPFVKGDAAAGRVFDGFAAVGASFGYEALALLTAWIGCAGDRAMGPGMLELAGFEAAAFARVLDLDRLGEILDLLAEVDVRADLAALGVPVALLVGESGRMGMTAGGTRRAVAAARELVPAAELVVIADGGGTYCMIEQPETSARAVRDISARISARAGVDD